MKPLRAFPFSLNVGTDICQISRIHQILRGPSGTRFVNRILAPEELHRAPNLPVFPKDQSRWKDKLHDELARMDPELWSSAGFIAGRFAAKEAAIKAHPHRKLTFHDVIIERRSVKGTTLGSGPPVARIRGDGEEDQSAMISISHDGDYATATCLGWDPGET